MQHAGFLEFLGTVVSSTFLQVGGVFGIFFVFGVVLFVLERQTTGFYARTIGWRGVLLTAWLGTPIHEIGHAMFCIVFRHRIVDFRPFDPDEDSGVLGYVKHAWDSSSIYQNIGNFFIGAGPLISGSLALYALVHLLVPNSDAIFAEIRARVGGFDPNGNLLSQISLIAAAGWGALQQLFAAGNLGSWQFWVFLYAAGCISSHIAPSPSDLEGIWFGLGGLIGLVLLVNVVTLLFGVNITLDVLGLTRHLAGLVSVFLLSVILSIINFAVTYLLLSSYWRIRGRGFLAPIG